MTHPNPPQGRELYIVFILSGNVCLDFLLIGKYYLKLPPLGRVGVGLLFINTYYRIFPATKTYLLAPFHDVGAVLAFNTVE